MHHLSDRAELLGQPQRVGHRETDSLVNLGSVAHELLFRRVARQDRLLRPRDSLFQQVAFRAVGVFQKISIDDERLLCLL